MTPEVVQRIQERLVTAIDDLRNAVGQAAAKAFLVSLTNVEPVGFEREAAICDHSWMEFVNEDFMIDVSYPSQSTPPSPSGKIEDPSLRRTVSQTVADTCNPAPSPHTANPMSLKSMSSISTQKIRWSYSSIQNLPRRENCWNSDVENTNDRIVLRILPFWHSTWATDRSSSRPSAP